jgi:XTP/dITP diphosphohydrolase
MKDLIIASNNEGKIKEYKEILEKYGYNVLSQKESGINIEVDETGTTFEENAHLKAHAIYELTHKNVISDDSGLEIEALNNEPGIYSARYKGIETSDERNDYILNALKDETNRKAKFNCVICFIDEKGHEELFKGIWNGEIAYEKKGTNGFGYDPIFISEDSDGKTTASMPIEFKEKYSHRAKATNLLVNYIENNNII